MFNTWSDKLFQVPGPADDNNIDMDMQEKCM